MIVCESVNTQTGLEQHQGKPMKTAMPHTVLALKAARTADSHLQIFRL